MFKEFWEKLEKSGLGVMFVAMFVITSIFCFLAGAFCNTFLVAVNAIWRTPGLIGG